MEQTIIIVKHSVFYLKKMYLTFYSINHIKTWKFVIHWASSTPSITIIVFNHFPIFSHRTGKLDKYNWFTGKEITSCISIARKKQFFCISKNSRNMISKAISIKVIWLHLEYLLLFVKFEKIVYWTIVRMFHKFQYRFLILAV